MTQQCVTGARLLLINETKKREREDCINGGRKINTALFGPWRLVESDLGME